MTAVNTPRPCVICGKEFYPSLSYSLFCCGEPDCWREYNGVMEDVADMNDQRIDPDSFWQDENHPQNEIVEDIADQQQEMEKQNEEE